MSFNITGTGSCHPKKLVTNDDLAGFLDTNDEWIRTRTGIRERRIMTDESLLDIAVKASAEAIADAGVSASEIDLLIFSTLQGDYISPSTACLLSKKLGINCSSQFDMNMGCSGFLFALDIADSYFKSKKAKKALIVCAEAMSKLVDWSDRSTCVLFGDGAGAVVLESGNGFKDISLTVNGEYEHLYVQKASGNIPFFEQPEQKAFLKMDGQEIYIFAVSSIIREISSMLEKHSMTASDPDYYIFHQANIRIIDSARKKLRQSGEKFPVNLDRYGNTSSASIPMLLDEMNREGKLKKGDILMLCTFGAGLTTGACIIEWNK
ncbi:MAG: ketoacyl-ACP synthase III [Eubacteriales bacterium]|nr:ketoacyl-ACP synthase III [Eubacteriales bacterium]